MEQTSLPCFQHRMDVTHEIPAMLEETAANIQLWTPYQPKKALGFLPARRLKLLAQKARFFPDVRILQPPEGNASRWCIYFCFLADGTIQPHHRFTIEKLVQDGISPLVVCAAPQEQDAQAFHGLPIQGLVWKGLNGYDFSGYSAGLEILADMRRPLSLFILNDSVLGPFYRIARLFENSPWKITSLIASHSVETHFQSFFLHIADFSSADLATLRRVFFRRICFNDQGSVSLLQETRIPSGFKARFSAGSVLSPTPGSAQRYYMLSNPAGLLEIGVPFVKRSIFQKFGEWYSLPSYNDLLVSKGHPPIA